MNNYHLSEKQLIDIVWGIEPEANIHLQKCERCIDALEGIAIGIDASLAVCLDQLGFTEVEAEDLLTSWLIREDLAFEQRAKLEDLLGSQIACPIGLRLARELEYLGQTISVERMRALNDCFQDKVVIGVRDSISPVHESLSRGSALEADSPKMKAEQSEISEVNSEPIDPLGTIQGPSISAQNKHWSSSIWLRFGVVAVSAAAAFLLVINPWLMPHRKANQGDSSYFAHFVLGDNGSNQAGEGEMLNPDLDLDHDGYSPSDNLNVKNSSTTGVGLRGIEEGRELSLKATLYEDTVISGSEGVIWSVRKQIKSGQESNCSPGQRLKLVMSGPIKGYLSVWQQLSDASPALLLEIPAYSVGSEQVMLPMTKDSIGAHPESERDWLRIPDVSGLMRIVVVVSEQAPPRQISERWLNQAMRRDNQMVGAELTCSVGE